jgi:hypothetical protein
MKFFTVSSSSSSTLQQSLPLHHQTKSVSAPRLIGSCLLRILTIPANFNRQHAVQARHRRPFLHHDVDRLRHARLLQGWLERHQHLRKDLLSLRWKHSHLRGGNYLRPDLYLRCLSVSTVRVSLTADLDALLRCYFPGWVHAGVEWSTSR